MNLLISLDGISGLLFSQQYQKWEEQFPAHTYAKSLQTVNPSVTYPVHVSAVTGRPPASHGIFENVTAIDELFTRRELYALSQQESRTILSAETIFDKLVKEQIPCKTIHWPLAAGFLSENRLESGVIHDDADSVSYADALDEIACQELMCDIEEQKNEVVAAHFVGYDAAAHIYGTESVQAKQAFNNMMDYMEQIIDKALEKDVEHIIFFSDHGLILREGSIFPNQYMAAHGYHEQWQEKKFRFLCDGSGSAVYYSHLSRPEDEQLLACLELSGKVRSWQWTEESESHMPMPKAVISFQRGICAEDIGPEEDEKYPDMKGIHGYDSDQVEEMNGFLFAITKGQEKTAVVESKNVIDIAGTIAAFYDISFETQGNPIREMI